MRVAKTDKSDKPMEPAFPPFARTFWERKIARPGIADGLSDRAVGVTVLLLLVGLVFLHVVLLEPIPFHADELFFEEQARNFHGDILAFAADSFDRFRFYRVLGRPINFSAYAWGTGHPIVLTGVITLGACAVVYAYAALLGRLLGNETNAFQALLVLTVLALPFSCYLILTRAVFHELVSMGLIGACLAMLCKTFDAKHRKSWFLGIAVAYTLSLFVYESALLAPVFFVVVAWQARDRFALPRRSVVAFCGFLLAGAAIYLGTQFLNIDIQPKLSDSMAIYAPYNAGLTYPEQFLRVALYALYHLKWSWITVAQQIAERGAVVALLLVVVLILAALVFHSVLRIRRTFLSRGESLLAMNAGAVLFVSTFGLWTYYWVVKKSIVFPPLYTMLFPALGLACAIVGLLSYHAAGIVGSRVIRAAMTIVFACAFSTSLVLILSSRFAISAVTREVQGYAEQIDRDFSVGANVYRNLVLIGLPETSMYGRRKIRYESMLLHYLKARGDQWKGVSLVANAVSTAPDGAIVAAPNGATLHASETLFLRHDAASGRLVHMGNGDVGAAAHGSLTRVDPYRVIWLGYQLGYSEIRANVVLSRQGNGKREHE